MADEIRHIHVLMGPYRDNRLSVTAAEADAAINAHWAVDPHAVVDPDHEPHPPLTDQQRTDALEAAHTWAKAQWDTAQGIAPPEPPPPEGGITRKAMEPEKGADYKTRQAEPKHEPKK